MKKKLPALIIFILVAILCFALVACNNQDYDGNNNDYDNENTTRPPVNLPSYIVDKTQATAFISIDINPSIELTLNYDNIVLSAYGANDDGKVLLYGEDGIVGKSIELAVSKITALSINLGYLSKDNYNVQTSVTTLVEGENDNLTESVNSHISAIAEGFDIDVNISELNSYSLNRRFDEFKENNPDDSEIQNLSIDEFRVFSSASEATGKRIETMLSLDTQQLLQTVSTTHKQTEEYETEEYKKEYSLASDLYEKVLGEVTDGIYTSYYMLHHPLRAYYGLAYQGYKFTAKGLRAIANAIDYIGELREYPLEDSQIDNVVKILGLENADELKNANGEVTVKSIEKYADKKFKETKLSAALEEMKANLTSALKTIENAIQAKIDEIAQKYAPELEVISNGLSSIIDGLKDFKSILPAPIQSAIDDFSDMVISLVDMVSDFKITVAEIRDLSDKAFAKSVAALSIIQNDLTSDELDEIARIQQSAINGIEDAKAKFEKAVQDAKASAKQYIENLKNQRKNA